MTQEAARILEILEQLVDVCGRLHEASQGKCRALAAMDLEALHEATDAHS